MRYILRDNEITRDSREVLPAQAGRGPGGRCRMVPAGAIRNCRGLSGRARAVARLPAWGSGGHFLVANSGAVYYTSNGFPVSRAAKVEAKRPTSGTSGRYEGSSINLRVRRPAAFAWGRQRSLPRSASPRAERNGFDNAAGHGIITNLTDSDGEGQAKGGMSRGCRDALGVNPLDSSGGRNWLKEYRRR
jgi:hypothetical protein